MHFSDIAAECKLVKAVLYVDKAVTPNMQLTDTVS